MVLDLDDVHVRNHILRLRWVVPRPRLGVETADDVDVLFDLFDRQFETAGELRQLMLLEQDDVIADDRLAVRILHSEMLQLEEQALSEVPARQHRRDQTPG